MRTLRHCLWVLVIVASASTPAFARTKAACKDHCADDLKECTKMCVARAGPKAVGYCKKACLEASKKCDDKCAKKSR